MKNYSLALSPTRSLTTRKVDQKTQQELEKLEQLAKVNTKSLFSCTTVFPFTLFPTKLAVDRDKITIGEQFFFWSKLMETLLIKDIMTVSVSESVLFASIEFAPNKFADSQTISTVNYLPKEDAQKFRIIVQGLMVAYKEKVDVSKIPDEELLPRLIDIGKTSMPAVA